MMLDDFRGKVRRVRVAFGPSYRFADPYSRVAKPAVHVGHARTLLIARHIADFLQVPLWIRINVAPGGMKGQITDDIARTRGQMTYFTDTLTEMAFSLAPMCSFLGIATEHWYQPLYPLPQHGRGYEALCSVRIASYAGGYGEDPERQWFDDAWLNWPSLIVRGGDWCAPGWVSGTQEWVGWETKLFEELGREKYEVNAPLLMADGKKMGSSDWNAVDWRVLMPLGRELAKSFLLRGIPLDALPGENREWSWDDWSEAVSRARRARRESASARVCGDLPAGGAGPTGVAARADDAGQERAGRVPWWPPLSVRTDSKPVPPVAGPGKYGR